MSRRWWNRGGRGSRRGDLEGGRWVAWGYEQDYLCVPGAGCGGVCWLRGEIACAGREYAAGEGADYEGRGSGASGIGQRLL